jgi:hypothetical protein
MAPIMADDLALLRLTSSPRPSRLNGWVMALLVIAGIALLPAWRPLGAAGVPVGTLSYAPQGIAAHLPNFGGPDLTSYGIVEESGAPHVWVPQVWASWFELAASPNAYSLDSRIELFSTGDWTASDAIEAGDGSVARLTSEQVSYVVTMPTDAALEAALQSSGAWTRSYQDADGSIWTHL